ncbi:hypothetical protein [Jatrophihabitans endophyticus]|uniref:hypothetical protein n=1 Tax=Jatrophihabitans endophyticus TaxID=1206085 RepID=UPI001A0BD44B|nr:hypothetical protein [Jatrophihabitans endophyticus]MBE7190603.1 hypothetical protein [Jatrophihabitans endophyticus]
MLTASAQKAVPGERTVEASAALLRRGWTADEIRAQVVAHRWQRFGRVVLLHNGAPDLDERRAIAMLNCGDHAVLTSFTGAEVLGLRGWERPTTHVLVAGGTRVRRVAVAPVRVHYLGDRERITTSGRRRVHRCAPALVIAAGSFDSPRPGCGILAAGVQQGLVTAAELRDALEFAPRVRHRHLLLAAVDDIEQGSHALSEIDLAHLCRRHGLPVPVRQAVRVEPSGRRRYLDAEWTTVDGRRVVAEIDGALHLVPTRWWDDALRQNEFAIARDTVLRFPTVILRTEELLVVDQLRRALG